MAIKSICFFLMIVILPGCGSKPSKSRGENEFEKLYNKLTEIELPLSMQTTEKIFSQDLSDIEDSILIRRFGGRGGFERPLGRLKNDSGVFVVLSFVPDDVGTPILTTYDTSGAKIDSFMVFDGKPASIRFSWTQEFVTIQPDLTIDFVDTTKILDEMENVMDTVVIRKTYFVLKEGSIKEKPQKMRPDNF
jgi:hypothetical protein